MEGGQQVSVGAVPIPRTRSVCDEDSDGSGDVRVGERAAHATEPNRRHRGILARHPRRIDSNRSCTVASDEAWLKCTCRGHSSRSESLRAMHRTHSNEPAARLCFAARLMKYCSIVVSYVTRREMFETSCSDMPRAVLAFCVWEQLTLRKKKRLGAGALHEADRLRVSLSSRSRVYRFLSPSERQEDLRINGGRDLKTVLASYPRSGNSLLRRLLEKVTGRITGDDSRPDRPLVRSLTMMGMQGEGVVDGRVRVVKTHYPERPGYRLYEAKNVVLLVRNPYDAIDSYFNLCLSKSHDRSLHDAVYEEFKEKWDGMIRNEIKVWREFHGFWLTTESPVYVLRYEDLLAEPARRLLEVIAFIHGMSVEDAERAHGAGVKQVATAVNAGGSKSAGPYKKRGSGKIGSSLGRRFSKEQLAFCVEAAGDMLRHFGYEPFSQNFAPDGGVGIAPLTHDLCKISWPIVGTDRATVPTASRSDTAEKSTLQSNFKEGAGEHLRVSPSTDGTFVRWHRDEEPCLRSVPDDGSGPGATAEEGVPSRSAGHRTVMVNKPGGLLREEDDPYGRAIVKFRHAVTKNDTEPLPLVGEDKKAAMWRLMRARMDDKYSASSIR